MSRDRPAERPIDRPAERPIDRTAEQQTEAQTEAQTERHTQPPGKVRRPRYVPFIVSGAVVGLIATVILAMMAGDDVASLRRLVLYLGILLGGLGALVGGGFAVWLERDVRDD